MFTFLQWAYFSVYKILTFFFENQMPKNLLFSFRYKMLSYNNLQKRYKNRRGRDVWIAQWVDK